MGGGAVRLGLVGLGKIARDQHVPAIAANPRFALVATASPHGGLDGVAAHADLATMLGAGHGLDAVALCTPPAVRAGLARLALEAGLHVLLEKPPAAGITQVADLEALAARGGCSLLTTWHSRETAAVDAARAWLAGRRVEAVRVIWREDVRRWHPGQDWLLAAGGFGVFDPAINALSILTHILPEPLALESAELGIPDNREAPMEARLRLRHGGVAAVDCALSILPGGAQQWDIAIDTDAGALLLSEGGHRLAVDGTAQAFDANAEYARLYARFAGMIDAGTRDVDARPLALVADAMMLGGRYRLPAFAF
ncbi:MAG TPA: Gfo/Idh/MocA family oxidoreductase [Novosphingobium sp.]|nr:Gfo/Idh/MocA family oxidoreductase [Novosphingobium sp.]